MSEIEQRIDQQKQETWTIFVFAVAVKAKIPGDTEIHDALSREVVFVSVIGVCLKIINLFQIKSFLII